MSPLDDSPANLEDRWLLRLYVAGQTPKALHAFANLSKLCEEHLQGNYEIEVVDLLINPTLAKDDQILALPTLYENFQSRLRKSSAIFPTLNVCWSV
jgi:circadian clock protein KaiB